MHGFFFALSFKCVQIAAFIQTSKNKKGCLTRQPFLCRYKLLGDYNNNCKNHYNGHCETSQRCDDQIPVNGIYLNSINCFHSQL
jgi:hypothetical protein